MSENELWTLPDGWYWSEAASLIDGISAGKSFKCEERPPRDGEIGIVKVSAVTWGSYDEMESKTCKQASLINPALFIRPGDFLFSRANTIELVGACVIADSVTRNVMLSDKILRFSIRQGWEKWLLWSLRSSHGRAEIERLATGNQESMRNIGQARVLSIRIPVSANGEQQRVVDALESYFTRLDDAVTTLERVERNLKRYRASVLKAAVEGRLVPTEAALARHEGRDYEPASVLLDLIESDRHHYWLESGKRSKHKKAAPVDTENLPSLPEGWCWTTIGQVAPLQAGFAFSSSGYRTSGVRLLKGNNVRDGCLSDSELDYWAEEESAEFEQYRLSEGDLVLAMDRPVYSSGSKLTKVAMLGPEWHGSLLLQRVGRFRRVDCLEAKYLYLFLSSDAFREHLICRQNGSQDGKDLPHVSAGTVNSCPFPFPPISEQQRIVESAEHLISVFAAAAQSLMSSHFRCLRLRQSILKWAFEGKLADQDPNDEPASILLERIKAERNAPTPAKKKTRS